MSPVGRAAPRSAAAIAGQAAGRGAREAAGSEGRAGDGGEGAREREARELGPGGARSSGRRMASGGAGSGGRAGGGGEIGQGAGRAAQKWGRNWGVREQEGRELGGWGWGVERCGDGRRREGRERAGRSAAEKGGKGGRARAEDGEGGGAGRILEVRAKRGPSRREGAQRGRLAGAGWHWNPRSSGNTGKGMRGGGAGCRAVRFEGTCEIGAGRLLGEVISEGG